MLFRFARRSAWHILKYSIRSLYPQVSSPHLHSQQIKFHFGTVPLQSKYYYEQLPESIPILLKVLRRQPILNEKLVLLEKLTELILSNCHPYLTFEQQAQIDEQLKLWEGGSGRFQRIVSVGWLIKRLGLIERHRGLYDQIARRIENDEWYVTLDESVKALETYADYDKQELKQEIMMRIEGNIKRTMFEERIQIYQRVAKGLLLAGRPHSELWEIMESFIVQSMNFPYKPEEIADLFRSYMLTQNGSHLFYEAIQNALYLGHNLKSKLLHKLLNKTLYSGEFYSMLVEAYSLGKYNARVNVETDLIDHIYSHLADSRVIYTSLNSFTRIIQCLPYLLEDKRDSDKVIEEMLACKLPVSVRTQEAIEFYEVLKELKREIPPALRQHIQLAIISNIISRTYSPQHAIRLADQLLLQNHISDVPRFSRKVEQFLIEIFKYLEGPEAKQMLEAIKHSKSLPCHMSDTLLLLPPN